MTTEVHNGANGTLKQGEVEPLEEIKSKTETVKPVDLVESENANGKLDGEALEEKEEPVQIKAAINHKGEVEVKENEEDGQDGNHYSSEEEAEGEAEAEAEEDDREEDGGQYEEDEEEYVEDEEDEDEDEEDEDDEPAPPPKRRK